MSGLYRDPADACSVRIVGTVSFCWAIPMVSFRADLCDHCSIHGTQNGLWENSIIQIIPGSFEPGIYASIRGEVLASSIAAISFGLSCIPRLNHSSIHP